MANLLTLCTDVKHLAESSNLRTILMVRIIIALAGIILSIILLRVQGRQLVLHKNAHVLLLSHHVFVILHCTSSISINAFDLIRFAHYRANPCDYLIPMVLSASLRGVYIVTGFGIILALFTMALERFISTYNYQTYERTGRYYWSAAFVASQWILSTSSVGIMIMNSDWKELKVQVTVTSEKTTPTVSLIMKCMTVVELVTFCVLLGLLRYNARKKKQMCESSLTEKYQIDENIRSIRLMIPMVITHFCCFMPALIAFPIYYWIDSTAHPSQYSIFLEGISGTTVLYGTLLPIVLFWRHKVLRENLRESIGLFESGQAVELREPREDGRTCEHVRHFELLESTWNG